MPPYWCRALVRLLHNLSNIRTRAVSFLQRCASSGERRSPEHNSNERLGVYLFTCCFRPIEGLFYEDYSLGVSDSWLAWISQRRGLKNKSTGSNMGARTYSGHRVVYILSMGNRRASVNKIILTLYHTQSTYRSYVKVVAYAQAHLSPGQSTYATNCSSNILS